MAARFTKPYVEAVREAAGSLEAFEALAPPLERLAAAVGESEELRTLLRNPGVRREQKRTVLAALASRLGLEGLALRLAGVLLANRRLARVSEMVTAIREQSNKERRILEAEVTTARPLTDGAKSELSRALEAKTGRTIRLSTSVEAALLGGFVIRVGSEIYDASLAHRLEKAKNALHAATGNVPR